MLDGTRIDSVGNIRCAHTPFGEALAFRQVAALAAEARSAV